MTSPSPRANPVPQVGAPSDVAGTGRAGETRRARQPRRSGGAVAWTTAASIGAALFAGLAVAAPAPKPGAPRPAGDKPKHTKPADSKPAPATAPATGPAASQPALLPSGRPVPAMVPADPAVLTDLMVDQAILKGANFLLKQFDAKTNLAAGTAEKIKDGDVAYAGGLDSLAVYALMQAGLALKDEPRGAADDPAQAAKLDARRETAKKLAISGPEMQAKIEAMAKLDLTKGRHQTYAHGLRSTALSLYVNSTPDFDKADQGKAQSALATFKAAVKERLKADAEWGVLATADGSYSYEKGAKTPKTLKDLTDLYKKIEQDFVKTKEFPTAKGGYDNSNCQYGLLGVWSAAEAEVEIPTLYWYLVANHWMKKQQGGGIWIYDDERALSPNPITMTAAGLASMLVTHEYIEPVGAQASVGREPYNTAIKKGLAWFDDKDNAMKVGNGYGAYGVERVGLASGFKFFGQNDWYRVLSDRLIKTQKDDGRWDGSYGPVAETAYYLLFLSRGRHPVLMNKLRFDGDKSNPGYWANRPRDAANLSKAVGKRIEQQLNWQVIGVDTPWQQWLDSPILSIGTHKPFKFNDEQLAKLRAYADAGGVIYVQSDGRASAAMDAWANQLAQSLFKRPLAAVPPTHPLYTNETVFKIAPPVPLKMVSNGSRVMMLYSPTDLAISWQTRDEKGKAGRVHYELGVNLYIYAAGKGNIRRRLESPYVPELASASAALAAKYPARTTVGVARLSYADVSPGQAAPAAKATDAASPIAALADWNPEPGAWPRFANWFQWQTAYKLAPTAVALADLKPFDPARKTDPTNYRFAHLTGTSAVKWTPAQVAAAKAFVEAGGVLMIDVTGGNNPFDQSAQQLIVSAFPSGKLATVAQDHPLLSASAPGMEDLSRRFVRQSAKGKSGTQLALLTSGKGAVIFSPLDVTSGLLGTNTVGVVGYDESYASKLMKNAVLWALDGTPAAAATPPAAATASPAPAAPPEAPAAPAAAGGADAGK